MHIVTSKFDDRLKSVQLTISELKLEIALQKERKLLAAIYTQDMRLLLTVKDYSNIPDMLVDYFNEDFDPAKS